MDYLKKNPKLVQLGFVLIGFAILILMTGQYSEIIDVRDGFTKAVERGEIASSVSFSDSVSMILRGQLPPQFVRIPELNFLNPVVSASTVYILTTLLIMAGLIFNNYYAKIQSSKISLIDWFKKYWTKLFLYALIAIFGGLFVAPSLFTWFFGEPESTSFWELPRVITEFANFLMYEWIPIEIYDPDIEEFEDKALIFQITRGISAVLLFFIALIREILLGGVKTIVTFTSWDWLSENKWAYWPALPWTVVCAGGTMLGYALKGRGLAMLAGFGTLYISIFGQWQPSMETLSFVLVAAPVSVIFNIAQSMPHFAYLVPVMVFFGIGDQAGAIATIIFATPPMIRLTLLGLKRVSPEVVDAGMMSYVKQRR